MPRRPPRWQNFSMILTNDGSTFDSYADNKKYVHKFQSIPSQLALLSIAHGVDLAAPEKGKVTQCQMSVLEEQIFVCSNICLFNSHLVNMTKWSDPLQIFTTCVMEVLLRPVLLDFLVCVRPVSVWSLQRNLTWTPGMILIGVFCSWPASVNPIGPELSLNVPQA